MENCRKVVNCSNCNCTYHQCLSPPPQPCGRAAGSGSGLGKAALSVAPAANHDSHDDRGRQRTTKRKTLYICFETRGHGRGAGRPPQASGSNRSQAAPAGPGGPGRGPGTTEWIIQATGGRRQLGLILPRRRRPSQRQRQGWRRWRPGGHGPPALAPSRYPRRSSSGRLGGSGCPGPGPLHATHTHNSLEYPKAKRQGFSVGDR